MNEKEALLGQQSAMFAIAA